MRKLKKSIAWILVALLVFSIVPVSEISQVEAKKTVKVQKVTLNKTIYTLKKGKKVKLKAKILPQNTGKNKLVWTSSKKKIATVSSSGVVKAKKNGTTKITVKVKGTNKKAVCKIIVGIPVTAVKLASSKKTLKPGQKFNLKATVSPAKATTKSLSYRSSNSKVASVNAAGVVTALKAGTASISATSKDGTGKKASCSIIVTKPVVNKPDTPKKDENNTETKVVEVEKISIPEEERDLILKKGETFQMHPVVLPGNASNKTLIYKSSNEYIAKVDSKGKITAGTVAGKANISISSENGKVVTDVTVTVTESVTGIKLNKQELEFYSNSAPEQLTAEVIPENASNKNVIWTTSDNNVVSVSDNGLVQPVAKEGTAIISAKTVDGGFEASCKVTISSGMKVTTAAALNELLDGNESYKIIHFVTEENGVIAIPSPKDADKFKDTTLKIDAPNATIVNYASFKKVEIIRIAKNTYEENKNNFILVSAPESHIIVQNGAEVVLELDKTANETVVENNGVINNLEVNTKGKVLLEGTSSQDKIPVKVSEKAVIATSKPLSVTAEQKAELILKAGSEGTEVKTSKEENIPAVSGIGRVTAYIETGDGITDEKTIIADKTTEDVGAVTISALKGVVVDADGARLSGVKVSLVAYKKDFNIGDFTDADIIKSTETNSEGEYTIESVEAGNYYLILQKDNYYDSVQTCTLSNVEGEVNNERHTMTSKAQEVVPGSVSGKIIDSVDGKAIEGLTVRIRKGQNNLTGEEAAREVYTDAEGNYKITDLEPGVYTVQIIDLRNSEGHKYISASFNVYIESGKESANNGTGLSPIIESEQVRFILTWGNEESDAPADLDSHLIGPKATSSNQFHTYYSDKTYEENDTKYADLDLDDTDWEGPETTTIYQKTSGNYYFLVHDFTNRNKESSTALSTSQAKVEVYSGSRLVNTFYVPNQEGTLWAVCSYNSITGTVTPINEMSYESDSDSVGANYRYGDLKVTGIQTNDFVKKATISGSGIKLRLASDDIQNHLAEIIPEIKLKGATYEVKEDAGDWILTISDGQGLERTYLISYSIDYGNKYVTSFEKNDNVKDYTIDEDENYISLDMKYRDLSSEEVRKTIKPVIEQSGVSAKVEEDDEDYYLVLTDTDGSSRRYHLYTYQYYADMKIESITGEQITQSKIEEDDGYNDIYLYGTADSFDKVKDKLQFTFGADVKENTGLVYDEEENQYTITVTSDYASITYYIYYYIDYGSLQIVRIESKNSEIIDEAGVNYDTIYLNSYNVNLSEKLIQDYLTFYFGRETITGKVVKTEDYYQYIITDSETGQSRTYDINCYESYTEDYGVISIESTDDEILKDSERYNTSIWLYGAKDSLEEMLKVVSFKCGENVISQNIDRTEDGTYLVLKCKNNVTRKYKLNFEMDYGYLYISEISSTSEQYKSADYSVDSNRVTIYGSADSFADLKDTISIDIREEGATWAISSREEDGQTVYYLTLTGSNYSRTYVINYVYEG